MKNMKIRFMVLVIIIGSLSLNLTVNSIAQVSTASITGLNMSFQGAQLIPYVSFAFKDTANNYTALNFKVIAAEGSREISSRTTNYGSYTNGSLVKDQIRLVFGKCDVEARASIDYIVYAYNGTYEYDNLITIGASSAITPHWACSTGTTTTSFLSGANLTNWVLILLLPATIFLMIAIGYIFYRKYEAD